MILSNSRLLLAGSFLLVVASSSFITAQNDTTDTTTSSAPGGTTTTAAPSDKPGESWPDFAISVITFFSALVLWFIICFVLSKWEDSRTGGSASAVPGASAGEHGQISSSGSSSSDKYAGNSASDTSNGYNGQQQHQGADGYMPVSIPTTPNENRGGSRI
jgi:hypothetical protein